MSTAEGPLLCLPYTWEINDVPMWAVQGQSSDELLKRLEATLAVLERELEDNPRVLSIGLHPHIAGVPHRVYYLEKALDHADAAAPTRSSSPPARSPTGS